MTQEVQFAGSAFGAANTDPTADGLVKPSADATNEPSLAQTWKERMMRGVDYDIHSKVEEDPLVAAIHANAEKWDPDTEFVFGFLQVVRSVPSPSAYFWAMEYLHCDSFLVAGTSA
jgi:hypothetical protein